MYVFTQLDGQQEGLSFTCPSLSLYLLAIEDCTIKTTLLADL